MHGSTKQNTVCPTQTEDPREADRQPDTATLFSDIDKAQITIVRFVKFNAAVYNISSESNMFFGLMHS